MEILKPYLEFDYDSCNGCGMCKKICICNRIEMKDDKPVEVEAKLCVSCGHCFAICPNNAIKMIGFDNDSVRVLDPAKDSIDADTMYNFLTARRAIRFFKDKKISNDVFEKLMSVSFNNPSYYNTMTAEFCVIDKDIKALVDATWDIMKVDKDDDYLIGKYEEWLNKEYYQDPFLWGGTQAICTFANNNDDAIVAATRVEMMAYAMGLGGFYLGFSMKAAKKDPTFRNVFKNVTPGKNLYSVFVIGYPKYKFLRTVPRKQAIIHWQ